MHSPYRGHRILPAGGAPPLDGFTAASAAYSFRKLRSAYAGSAVQLRRASDNAVQNIGFLGFVPGLGSPWDSAAATAFCASTTCFVKIRYDQSGNGRDLTSVDANNPALVINCTGPGNILPCMQTTSATSNLLGPSFTPATGLGTVAVVAMRSAQAAGGCAWYRIDGVNNRLAAAATANNWTLQPGATFTGAAADAAWHAAVGILHPAAGSSVLNIDGTETTGTTVPVTTAAVSGEVGGSAPTCNHGEVIYWDNYNMPPAERAAVVGNQRSFWGTP
jgi:hypothetical protein